MIKAGTSGNTNDRSLKLPKIIDFSQISRNLLSEEKSKGANSFRPRFFSFSNYFFSPSSIKKLNFKQSTDFGDNFLISRNNSKFTLKKHNIHLSSTRAYNQKKVNS